MKMHVGGGLPVHIFYYYLFLLLFLGVEIYSEGRVVYILDASSKYPIIFQCYFRCVVHIFDASRKTLNYSSIFPRRVDNVQDASPKYATIFQCYFGRVIQIFDESESTFMTPPLE